MDSNSLRPVHGIDHHRQVSSAAITLSSEVSANTAQIESVAKGDDLFDASDSDLSITHKQAHRLPVSSADSIVRSIPSEHHPLTSHGTSPLPQIKYKPRYTPPRSSVRATTSDATRSPNIGAVARLAIDGGLTTEQLLRIGHATADPPLKASNDNHIPESEPHAVSSVTVQPGRFVRGHATSILTHCVARPVFQPVPHCTTHQPIYLSNRPAAQNDSCKRHQTLARGVFASPSWYNRASRRGSFPLQMTRVGGLVLRPSPFSNTDDIEPHHYSPYQSVSACASPAGQKHSALSSAFFGSTSRSSPSGTPPISLSSTSPPSTEIVRLGPGNTVTHALSTDMAFNATALIRMHDCPKPYVRMTPTGQTPTPCSADETLEKYFVVSDPPMTSDEPEIRSLLVSSTLRSPSPEDGSSWRTSVYPNTLSRWGNKSSGFCSPPGTQVARTVRHLRRIRHIFGNSIGYSSAVTSASTGALIQCDKEATLSSNSLVELRAHESRSADSIRPASYTCKCPSHVLDIDYPDSLTWPCEKPSVVGSLVRFKLAPNERWTCWGMYQIRLVENTLVMNRLPLEKHSIEQAFYSDCLSHLHVPLTLERLSWHRPEEHYPDWKSLLPHDSFSRQYYVLATLSSLDVPSLNTECQILLNKLTAIKLLGNSEFVPGSWDSVVSEHKITPEDSSKSRSRDRSSSGRIDRFGVAGPPGGLPMFRAASTAAASVGVPIMERTELSPVIRSVHDPLAPDSSVPPSLSDNPVDSASGTVKTSATFTHEPPSEVSSTSKQIASDQSPKRSRLGRGRLHEALNRMRRAATASSEATARSFTNAAATTRRFASTHGLFTHSKSVNPNISCAPIEPDVVSSPCLPAPCLDLLEHSTPGHLAASVSPSVALQTPCLTYMSSDSVAAIKPIASCAVDPSSTVPETEGFVTDRLCSKSLLTSSDFSNAKFATQGLIPASSFVPLPLPASGFLPLHKCPRSTLSPFVPFIVELCVTLVERFGLNCVGLYRLSGSKVAHDFISSELRKTLSEIDVTSDKWNDIHAVCGVLKTFLRNLPDSLFPKVMYADFLGACKIPQREKRLLSIQRLLSIMECYPHHPEYRAHRATLRYLATHLARVSARETVNKMTAYNLALVFAPNLVQPCEDSPELLMTDSKFKIMLVETVIKYHSWIFSPDLGLESGCSIPSDSVDDLVSAVASTQIESTDDAIVTAPLVASNSFESEEVVADSDRLDGDIQLLVCELFRAAADLPPPPSDIDLETAEEPGPSSDRPSDIVVSFSRPRFTSIPTNAWSSAALRAMGASKEEFKTRPELIFTQETDVDLISDPEDSDHSTNVEPTQSHLSDPRTFPAHIGAKLDNLRHLSQGCLDQYTSEARQLGAKVAETKRQLELTVAQRLHAEQLLHEARRTVQFSESLFCDSSPSASSATSNNPPPPPQPELCSSVVPSCSFTATTNSKHPN